MTGRRTGGRGPQWRAALVVLVFAGASCSSFGFPEAGTEQAADTTDLWRVFFVAAAAVAAVVYGLILWSLVRYRRRRGDDRAEGAPFRAHVTIEVAYTAIPVVLVAVLFALSFATDDRVTRLSPDPDVTLRAEAFSWGWRFTYEGEGVSIVSEPSAADAPLPEIALPAGRTTRFVLTSTDVIHALWVPGFLFKRDAIPGRVTVFDVTPTEPGEHRGECAEFCGLNHAYMHFTLRVMSPEGFEAWLDQRRAETA